MVAVHSSEQQNKAQRMEPNQARSVNGNTENTTVSGFISSAWIFEVPETDLARIGFICVVLILPPRLKPTRARKYIFFLIEKNPSLIAKIYLATNETSTYKWHRVKSRMHSSDSRVDSCGACQASGLKFVSPVRLVFFFESTQKIHYSILSIRRAPPSMFVGNEGQAEVSTNRYGILNVAQRHIRHKMSSIYQ